MYDTRTLVKASTYEKTPDRCLLRKKIGLTLIFNPGVNRQNSPRQNSPGQNSPK